jgi:hypothetical protein
VSKFEVPFHDLSADYNDVSAGYDFTMKNRALPTLEIQPVTPKNDHFIPCTAPTKTPAVTDSRCTAVECDFPAAP